MAEFIRKAAVQEYHEERLDGASSEEAISAIAARHGRPASSIRSILKSQGVAIPASSSVKVLLGGVAIAFFAVCAGIGQQSSRNAHNSSAIEQQGSRASSSTYAPDAPACRELAAMSKADLEYDCEQNASGILMKHFDPTTALGACFETHARHFKQCGLIMP